MSKGLGAVAVAACASGLLFSGAASASQAANTISVKGVVMGPAPEGTYVQFFSGNSPLFKQITLSGRSNFHFSWSGAPCKLTPANGGVRCDFIPFGGPARNFWVNTIISGTLPTTVVGTIVYADDSTGTFSAPITEGSPASYSYSGQGVIVKGTSIQISFANALPPIHQFSLEGGSNWHLTGISSTAGGSCGLTASNGGGSCAFAPATTGFALTATFSGPRPTHLYGQITWSDNTTVLWDYRAPCYCTKLSAELTGFKEQGGGTRVVFFLKWKLDCVVGATDAFVKCNGFVHIRRPKPPPGVELRQGPKAKPWARTTRIRVLCDGSCKPTAQGAYQLELVGPAAARARERISFLAGTYCQSLLKNKKTDVFTLAFDKHGHLDRLKSHLGTFSLPGSRQLSIAELHPSAATRARKRAGRTEETR